LTDKDTTTPVWWHYLVVVVPIVRDERFLNKSSIWVTGGQNHDGIPKVKD